MKIFKQYLFLLFIHPLALFFLALCILYANVRFFVVYHFFSAAGSSDMHAFFSSIPALCVFIMPSLAALFPATENDYAMPASSLHVVFCKTISLALVFFLGASLTCFVPWSVSFFGDVAFSHSICAYCGILLYCITAASVSVLVFALAKNRALALFYALVFMLVANNIHLVSIFLQTEHSILSRFLYYVSLAAHFSSFSKSIFDSRDIVFYLFATVFFIACASFFMEYKRGKQSVFFKKNMFLFCLAILFASIASHIFYVRVDTSKAQTFTVQETSKAILSELEEPLYITYFRSKNLQTYFPQVNDVDDFLRAYSAEHQLIAYSVQNPKKKGVETALANFGIESRELQVQEGDATTTATVYSAIVLQYVGKTEIIPFVIDARSLEYALTSRVQSLVQEKKRAVQIVVANALDLEKDYNYIIPWFESEGFTVTQTFLPSQNTERGKEQSFTQLAQVPLIVLGTALFMPEDASALHTFIRNGGKAVIASTPYTIDIKNDWSLVHTEDYVFYNLQAFGLYVNDEVLVADKSSFMLTLFAQDAQPFSTAAQTASTVQYVFWPTLAQQNYAQFGLTLFWPAAVITENSVAHDFGYDIKPFLFSSKNAWQVPLVNGYTQTNPFVVQEESAHKEQYAFAALITQNKKSQFPSVIFVGDQYMFSTAMLSYTSSERLLDFRPLEFLSDCALLVSGDETFYLKENRKVNTSLYKVSLEELVSKKRSVFMFVTLVPLLILVLCFTVLRALYRVHLTHISKKIQDTI